MGSKNPQALSSSLAPLGMLKPRAFGFLKPIDQRGADILNGPLPHTLILPCHLREGGREGGDMEGGREGGREGKRGRGRRKERGRSE